MIHRRKAINRISSKLKIYFVKNHVRVKRQVVDWEQLFRIHLSDITHEERRKKPQISTVKTSILLAKGSGDTKRHFSEEDVRTADEPMKRCLLSLATWAVQIKTIKTGYRTPIRTAEIKNSGDTQCW